MKKIVFRSILALATAASMAACDSDNEFPGSPVVEIDLMGAQCADNGVWTLCYTNNGGFAVDGINFSHESDAAEYDGVVYESWYGFCPSVVEDTKDYTVPDEDGTTWVDHQWASITGGSLSGTGAGYLVGCWNTRDAELTDATDGSCVISGEDGITFFPDVMYVTNTTWGYYAMKNGSDFSKAFGVNDWCKLTITAYKNGIAVGSTDVFLAAKGQVLDKWQKVELGQFGIIDDLVFTMSSSDSGQWGMNNPAYFCIDGFRVQ